MSKQKKGTVAPHPLFGYSLVVLGSLLILLWGIHSFLYQRAISLADSVASSSAYDTQELPLYIDIPGIPRLSVVEGGKIQGNWTISDKAANHVRTSAVPGKTGNIIVYGHNTYALFGRLPSIEKGAIVSLRTRKGELHQYKVVVTAEVDPSETELLQPTASETLTLYTCSGWFDSMRFVVRAVPLH